MIFAFVVSKLTYFKIPNYLQSTYYNSLMTTIDKLSYNL